MGKPIRTGDFWAGPAEAATYLEAVVLNPKRDDEGAMSYIVRISEIVTGEAAAYEGKLQKLRGQLPSRTEVL